MNDGLEDSFLDRVIRLQNGLIATATGGGYDDVEYKAIRRELSENSQTRQRIPSFVRRCSDVPQFWGWIKYEVGTYAERRDIIWNGFQPLIEYLEFGERTPSSRNVEETLDKLDAEHVKQIWQKAIDRRTVDPEGAITAARSLIESTCKIILEEMKIDYDHSIKLPKLWSETSKALNLAPSQHQEEVFKSILGSCHTIVNNLGEIRNKISDAHGQGRKPIRPKPRHAELAVNLAGTMAAFLVATWEEKKASENE